MGPEGFSENSLKILETRYFLKNEKGERLDNSLFRFSEIRTTHDFSLAVVCVY